MKLCALMLMFTLMPPCFNGNNHLKPDFYNHLPHWLKSMRSHNKIDSHNCEYTCMRNGACTVQFRGYTLGKCLPDGGDCVGTPKECKDCSEMITCKGHGETSILPRATEGNPYSVFANQGSQSELGGCISSETKFPSDWIPLLKNPCRFLEGPVCNSSPMKNIGIVGAGMAGLTIAYLMETIGHNVTLLEKTHRHGGRAYTYHGTNGLWDGDLGAMRFPPRREMPLIHAMFDLFNIPLANFTNTNEGPSSYIYIGQKHFSYKSFSDNDTQTLNYIYSLFDIDTKVAAGTFPRNASGALVNPSFTNIRTEFALDLPNNFTNLCIRDESLKSSYDRALREKNLPQKLLDLWSVLELNRAFLPYSAYQGLFDTPQEHQRKCTDESSTPDQGSQFQEIIGGVSVLPDSIFERISTNTRLVRKLSNAAVRKVEVNKDVVQLYYDQRHSQYDKVVMTPTSTALSLMEFSPPLPYKKTFAFDSINYMNSVKVFLAFKDAFWAKKNKIPKINFNSTTEVNGGSGVTDLPARVIYYPSSPFHGYSLLASYVWGQDADILTGLKDEDVVEVILDNLVEIHGQVARDQFKEGKVIKWAEEDWTIGAFPWADVGHFHKFGDAVQEHVDDRIFFAGEYTSKFDHGWIQGAVESACRVSYDMFGNGRQLYS